jgi:Hsp70 protein
MTGATGAGFRLGIDFGTSHTTAILRWPDGHVRPLLFDGSPLLPSAVYAEDDGSLLVGRDAVHAARLDPGRFEGSPKRRIDRDAVALGPREVTVAAMIAAVLGRVKAEAERVSSARIDDVTLTHPAGWTGARLAKLVEACRLAGLPDPAMVPEPVAAAGYFVSVLGRTIPSGSALVVYDFGGGTFDASAVAPAQDGYRVLAMAGLDNLGGVDLDAALLEFIATVHRGQGPEAWQRLEEPLTPADRRHRRHLVEDVRAAKEMLSRAASASVPVPVLELEARISREEFDALARPLLDRTVSTTADVIRSANLPPERIAAVLLVGGSSRIPLVVDLLRRGTGVVPSTIEQPETVVAEGSVRLASGASGTTRAASTVPAANPLAPAADPRAATRPPVGVPAGRPAPLLPTAPLPTPVPPLPTPVPPVPISSVPPQWTPASDRTPPRTYSGARVTRRRRQIWIPIVLALLLLVVGGGTAVALLRPDLLRQLGLASDTGSTAFVRTVPPEWLPAGWSSIVDDEQVESVVAGPATNGGTCTYTGDGVVRVQRDSADVSGCPTAAFVEAIEVRDVAVEAELSIAAGCAGMWVRTGARGYFLAICRDSTIRLHELGDSAVADGNRLIRFAPAFDPANVVVGLLVRDTNVTTNFTVYVDGKALQTVSNGDIRSGHIGIGGYAPEQTLDATFTRYRAWAPDQS